MKHKYFILYSNGQVESVEKIDDTLLRLVENSVISLIYDIEKNVVKSNSKEGLKEIKVPLV